MFRIACLWAINQKNLYFKVENIFVKKDLLKIFKMIFVSKICILDEVFNRENSKILFSKNNRIDAIENLIIHFFSLKIIVQEVFKINFKMFNPKSHF